MITIKRPPSDARTILLSKLRLILLVVIFLFGYSFISFGRNSMWPFISLKLNNLTHVEEVKYVSFCKETFNGRRMGNLMFDLAALLYVARHTARQPVLPEHIPFGWIDDVFETSLPKFANDFIYNASISLELYERFGPLVYDERIRNPHFNKNYTDVPILLICGYFQSFLYMEGIEEELKNHLTFKNSTTTHVNEYMNNYIRTGKRISTVGLHVRRTDFMNSAAVGLGFVVANESYINTSILYFVRKFIRSSHIVVFVCSDDIKWVKSTIENLEFKKHHSNISFVYSVGQSPAFDMCLLSKCSGIIITVGSFGWWSARLANTTTVYFSEYPKKNSALGFNFNSRSYYDSNWIGLS